MKLNLSGLPTDDKRQRGKQKERVRPDYWRVSERGTSQYRAFRTTISEEEFKLYRMPSDGWDAIPLGKCKGRSRADAMLLWWVQQDERVRRILSAQEKQVQHEEAIEDMMIECARKVPLDASVEPTYSCMYCEKGFDEDDLFQVELNSELTPQRLDWTHRKCAGGAMSFNTKVWFRFTGEVRMPTPDEPEPEVEVVEVDDDTPAELEFS